MRFLDYLVGFLFRVLTLAVVVWALVIAFQLCQRGAP